MENIEKILQKNAYYGQGRIKTSKLPSQILDLEFEEVSKGTFSRVYKIKNTSWIVKEGRWDTDLKVWGDLFIPIPTQPLDELLKLFNTSFLPTSDEIKRQYQIYFIFIKYFGFFSKNNYYHPRLNFLQKEQREIRSRLIDSIQKIEEIYKIELPNKIEKIINDVSKTNFLPKEYTLTGKSISQTNHEKATVFIFQRYIQGKSLHDIEFDQMSVKVKKQLILFLFLTLVMRFETNLIPDLRPRYLIFQATDWFFKTDNMIISTEKNSVKFIDTRWLWEADSNYVKRGLMIPDLIITSVKYYLKKLLEEIY